jgi:hypothetical protein
MAHKIRLKRDATCHECGARITAGTLAEWFRTGVVIGLFCHGQQPPASACGKDRAADNERSAA